MDIVNEYSASFNYEIKSERNNDIDGYYASLQKNNYEIELTINKSNHFEVNCSYSEADTINFEDALELVNKISKKEYSYEFADSVINNADAYYNCEEYYVSNSYQDFELCKIDYLDLTADYCLQYIKYDDSYQVISFTGFTK